MSSSNDNENTENNIDKNNNDEIIFIYKSGMTNKDVPKNVKRVKIDSEVKRIEEDALYQEGGRKELYEVDFSEATSLEEIGKDSFYGCTSLLEVDLPSSVNKIEERAFSGCSNLVKVKMMEGLKVIGRRAFYKCQSLSEVEIPSTVERIEERAFNECGNLAKVKMMEGLKVIGDAAFKECESLLEVEIPSTVERIEERAFLYCGKLSKVKMMEGLKVIGEYAFFQCKSLLEVEIPSTVERIEERAFLYCGKLSKVKMMEGLKVIGEYAFFQCKSLLEVEIPSTVERIEEGAFWRCSNLARVKMMEGLKVIGVRAFYQCKSLSEVELPSSVNTIEERAFQGCQKLVSIKAKEESQLKVVGKFAFACCQALSEVDIPPSVNKNVNGAFAGCKKLMMEDHEPVFLYKAGMTNEDVPVNVMRVKIDSNVKRIEEKAFYEQEELYEVDFSEATSLEEIGETAFLEVEIPSSVNTIGKEAFQRCYHLTNAKMEEGLKVIGEKAFYECTSLLEVEIPSSVNKIEERAFEGCSSLAKVKMVEGLTFIGEKAFYDCEALPEVDVPASVTFVATDVINKSKCVTTKLGNNVALCIRLCVTHPDQTQETIPLDKLVSVYSHAPIKTQELQDPLNQKQLDLLQSTKSEYIKLITSLNVATNKDPLLSFQEQNGWVQFVTNYGDYVNKEESKVLVEFLSTVDREIVKTLAFAKDKHGRPAFEFAVPSVGDVFRKRLLFQGRYDIAPGPPIHKSATCIVVKAEDNDMPGYYEEIYGLFQQQGLDLKCFGAALELLHVVSNEKSKLVEEQIQDYFERVDLDNSGKISKKEFVQFCSAQFGNNVVLKFMRNKDQFERELDGRKSATSGDDVDDRRKDDLLAKYVVSVIRSYDKDTVDTATLEDAVAPYLSKEEEPEKYCHVLVMPYGDRNLDTIFRSERPELTKVRDMLKDVGNALLHLHEKRNLVHGDLKMLNAVRVQGRLSLIDLDASAKIGSDYAGAKFSSGVLPPEMIHQLKDAAVEANEPSEAKELETYYKNEDENERVKRAPRYSTYPRKGYVVKSYLNNNDEDGTAKTDGLRYDLIKAHPSLDVWSFGVLLYAMCTGEQSLFSVSRDDDIVDGDSLGKLFDWGPDSLLSDRKLRDKVVDPYARDLLLKILTKDPTERPTMRQVLEHAFFDTEKQTNVEVQQLQKVVRATAKENQNIMKREFAKVHESLKVVIQKQLAMQNMLKAIMAGEGCPKYLIILPAKKGTKGMLSWFSKTGSLKSFMYEDSDARICFVCPISLRPVIGSDGEAIGYDLKLPKEWVKQYGPAILIGLKMVQVGFAIGRGFGLPFPSLGDASEKVAESLGEVSDLLSNMQDIAMEGLGLEEDDDLADLFVDKVSETTEEAMLSADDMKNISEDGRKKIQESYEGIGELVKDEKFERCGLVKAFCEADGTTEFVHPDLKALYEKKGQSVLKTMGPEMIDNAAAAARAGARNLSESEGVKQVQTVMGVTSEEARTSLVQSPMERSNNEDDVSDDRLSKISRQIIHEVQQSLSIRDTIEPINNIIESLLDERFSTLSKQMQHEVQQSFSMRDTIQLSESTRVGGSIVHEGRFQIQSQSFPHRWKERQFFLYDDLSIRHFPVSGQWLWPSNGRWQAKKAENGDGMKLTSGDQVCTLRLSGKANDNSKSPQQNINEWVAMLNSPSTVTTSPSLPDTTASHGPPSKAAATIKRIDSTGEIIST